MTTISRHGDEPLLHSTGSSSRSSTDSIEPRGYWTRLVRLLQIPGHDRTPREIRIITCVLCIQFLISFAKHITEVPSVRLFEIAICNRYYLYQRIFNAELLEDPRIDEKQCKIPEIQNDLTFLVGWRFAFDALPGLLTALFYGRLADRIGRRPILVLSCLGLLCSLCWIVVVCYANEVLPVKLVWASSMFVFIVSISFTPGKN